MYVCAVCADDAYGMHATYPTATPPDNYNEPGLLGEHAVNTGEPGTATVGICKVKVATNVSNNRRKIRVVRGERNWRNTDYYTVYTTIRITTQKILQMYYINTTVWLCTYTTYQV